MPDTRTLDEIEFTLFDTETTGLEPRTGDRIVEIAGIRYKGKEAVASFQSLVNPGRTVSEAAFRVNQITEEMVRSAPAPDTVFPSFLGFIRGSCLCSYNAPFDMEFLDNELKLIGRELPQDTPVVDILRMAKRLLPGLERYALWFVADTLGIKTPQKHRALGDVELMSAVFFKLKDALAAKTIVDFKNFSGLFGLDSSLLESINAQKIAQIQEAISLGVKLKMRYLSTSNAEVTEREVIPKEIRQDKNRSYLVGYCCLRKDERAFRIDGILHLEIE